MNKRRRLPFRRLDRRSPGEAPPQPFRLHDRPSPTYTCALTCSYLFIFPSATKAHETASHTAPLPPHYPPSITPLITYPSISL